MLQCMEGTSPFFDELVMFFCFIAPFSKLECLAACRENAKHHLLRTALLRTLY